MYDFSGRAAVITGGGSGIGKAVALTLARAGARVAVLDINAEAASRTKDEIIALGGQAIADEINVTGEASVAAAFATVERSFGAIDIAFNSAGVRHERLDLIDTSLAAWKRIVDVNLTGVFLCVKAELAAMIPRKRGAIVNVASMLGIVGREKTGPYTASKHAIVGLTKTAALEAAAHGIRVNAVAPGFTATPMTEDMVPGGFAGLAQAVAHTIPLGRLAAPEEIAAVVAWLCSDQSSYVTGHTLTADGGFTAP